MFTRGLQNWTQFKKQKSYKTNPTHIRNKQCENSKIKNHKIVFFTNQIEQKFGQPKKLN
jgi:hypothetical protein